jgi:hypothetical protein
MSKKCGCDCNNIEVIWDVSDCDSAPRACQCDYCFSKSAAYVSKSGTAFEVVIRNSTLHSTVQHGSNSAVFHECARCEQIVFVSAEIEGTLYGALNVKHLSSKQGFSAPIKMDFSGQTAEQKRERWRQNWCHPVRIAG